jgi:hypothetical protein
MEVDQGPNWGCSAKGKKIYSSLFIPGNTILLCSTFHVFLLNLLSSLLSIDYVSEKFFFFFFFFLFLFFFFCCSHLEHKASVKRIVSLQFLNLRKPVGLLGRGISLSQGRYLIQTNIYASSGIRTHDPSVRGGEDIWPNLLCVKRLIGRNVV